MLKVLDHLHRLAKYLLALAPLKEDGLRAEHLGHLGEHRRPPQRDEPVGKPAHGGVGGDAGQPIRPAALHAHHQLGGGDILPPEAAGVIRQLGQQIGARFDLVGDLLADQELHPLFVIGPQLRLKLLLGQILLFSGLGNPCSGTH